MALGRRRLGYAIFAVLIFIMLGIGAARADIERPNSLDRRVDAIPQSTLLTQPATALVDPARQTAAVRRVHWTLPGWILMQLFEAVALFYLWSSGRAAALRDWLTRRIRSEWGLRFAFGAALGLVARLAAFIPAFYLYRVERVWGLSTELTRVWGLYWLGHTMLAMIVAGIIAAVVLWLVERTHQWYIYTIVATLAASVGWAYVSPYFQLPGSRATTPVTGPLAIELDALLVRAGLPGVPILVETVRSTPVGRALVVGWGASHRIVLTDTLVEGDSPPEVAYEVAYELGHIVHGDPLSIALIEGGIIIVFAALAVVIADRIGFRRDDDPLSRLAIVGALFAIVYLAAVPVRNAALRSYDLDADRYAVTLTGNPAAAVRSLVRESDQRMEEACPDVLTAFFLDTRPALGSRVAAINHVRNGCP
jgi:STE24 endopeptidase